MAEPCIIIQGRKKRASLRQFLGVAGCRLDIRFL